jgi:outer membrane protein assembly factor BamA
MMRHSIFVVCGCLLFSCLVQSQRRVPSTPQASGNYKLLAVKASGSARYTDTEILPASSLQIGQSAAEGDFKEAAEHLLNSGMFTGVAYTFSYSSAGIKVEFQLTDIDGSKLIPAHFENFVWFTDSELRKALDQHAPLFQGLLPISGHLTDQVTTSLQAVLDEHHLPGRVDFSREGPQDDSPPTGITFRVRELSIRIHDFEFPGATSDQIAVLTYGARTIAGTEYSHSLLATAIRDSLLPLYLQRGYLNASFGSPETRVLPPSPEPDHPSDEIGVDVILPVTAGKQYSVSSVDWRGNSAIPTKDAAALFHLVPGQPADAISLKRDLEALTKLYRSRGYMTAKIRADPEMNDAANTVHYAINVMEGDLYIMGELEFLGVDTASRDRLAAAWKLPEGQPYNPDYTRTFLDEAPQLLPKGLRYSIKLTEELDAKAKAVDVTIHFKTD